MSFLRHAGLMNTDLRTDIAELDVSALEDALDALGRPRFHARQISSGSTNTGWSISMR